MDLPRLVVIDKLNKMALHYSAVLNNSFSLFNYKIEVLFGVHFKDRVMQRYPTYEVASNLLSTYMDLFIQKYSHYLTQSLNDEVEVKIVNIRHPQLYKQNVVVLKIRYVDGIILVNAITMYKATTSTINSNPSQYVYLHKKTKFFAPGDVGKKLLKFAKNNEVPEELKCITKLWEMKP